MTINVRAVYADGVLRPVQPLALAEGETVEVAITPVGPALRAPTRDEEDYALRVREAHSLDALLAILPTAPPLPDGYDLSRALNENRQANGERVLFPEQAEGNNP
jgi:predicted DNA-binding antitoxin AbrB/MazE fold protein